MASHPRTDPAPTVLDLAERLLLVTTLVVLPWLIGGVLPLAQRLLAGATLVTLVGWLLRYRPASTRGSAALPPAIWGLVAALVWGGFQLIPWPPEQLDKFSPRAREFRETPWTGNRKIPSDALEDVRREVGVYARRASATISLYPASTRHDLTLLGIATALFFLGSQFLRRATDWPVVLFVIALHGVLFSFFGIAQQLVWSQQWIGKIYGAIELTEGGHPFAAFVNRNNGVGHLNLCLAAAIGLLVYYVSGREEEPRYGPVVRSSSAWNRLRDQAVRFVAELTAARLVVLMSPMVIGAGIVTALSRGGWLASAAALSLVLGLLWRSRRLAAALFTATILIAVAWFVVWLGQGSAVQQRWWLLQDQLEAPSDGRLHHWQVARKAAGDFWATGTGLGTYRYVYRAYLDRPQDAWFYHAENQYVEALVEGGVIGLSLLLAMLAAVFFACYRLLRQPRGSTDFAWGVTGLYACTTQAVHSLFDFGLYMPANMALFAFLCGGLCGRASQLGATSHSITWLSRLQKIGDHSATAPVLATTLLWFTLHGLFDLNAALEIRQVMREARKDPSVVPTRVTTMRQLRTLGESLRRRPDDAEGRILMARLLIEKYRLDLVEARVRMGPQQPPESIWPTTSTLALQGRIYGDLRDGKTLTVAAFRKSDGVLRELRQAAAHLIRAGESCPVLPESWLLLGEITPLIAESPADRWWLKTASRTARGRRLLLRECGVARIQAGDVLEGLTDMWHAARSPEEQEQVLEIAWQFDRFARSLDQLPIESPLPFLRAARRLASRTDRRLMVERLAHWIAKRLPSMRVAAPERQYARAQIRFFQGKTKEGVEFLTQAVHNRPDEARWRAELVQRLLELGRAREAVEHARHLRAMAPRNRHYLDLLKKAIRQEVAGGPKPKSDSSSPR